MKNYLPFFFCLLVSTMEASTYRPGKDYALFFANDDYNVNPHFRNLKNPVKDAKAIEKELKEVFGFQTRIFSNYSKGQIYQKLEEWQQKTFLEDAQLFVFFTGHGIFNELETKGYFVPNVKDADYGHYIDLTSLGNIITKIPCKHILLAIDACYSGTIDEEIAFKGGKFKRPGTEEGDRANMIHQQLRNKTRLLITSGGKKRTPDGEDHSPFTNAILSGLRSAYVNGEQLFLWTDLLAQLERVSPIPHQGHLRGHEDGGFVFVVEQPNDKKADFFKDRDGNTYPFQRMEDGKVWMTKNLNIDIGGSYCYNNDLNNCDQYGRLYIWESAKEGCAALGNGWRLPTDEEWRKLMQAYGKYPANEGYEKEWDRKSSFKNLTQGGTTSFDGAFGGIVYKNGVFRDLNNKGYYWSATERLRDRTYGNPFTEAYIYIFDNFEFRTLRIDLDRELGISVRCIKDN